MVAPSESALFASSTSMIRIVDAVRNNILKWSLDLEQQGILCDGISFSETGKQGAESMQPTYNIGNIIGSMNNSQVQQANSNSTQTLTNGMDMDEVNQFMDMLTSSLGNLKLQQEQLEEMYNDIKMINLQVASKNPKNIVVVECMKSIRTMLESTGGNLASGLLIPALCKLIGC